MKIALLSLDQAWEDKNLNKGKCLKYIKQASAADCELAVFPEMTLTGFTMNTPGTAEGFKSSETILFFSDLAQKNKIWIVFGMIIENDPLPLNCAITVSPEGKVISKYEKIHPFSYAGENKYFSNGNMITYFQLNNCNIGISICYDLRFPELYQAISKKAEIIINIANWPASRIEHWNALLKARAIENQVFMIGTNRTGTDGNGIGYIKSSKIYDPNGDILKPVIVNEEIDYYDVDLSLVDFYRTKFPFRKDRKPDLYKSFL